MHRAVLSRVGTLAALLAAAALAALGLAPSACTPEGAVSAETVKASPSPVASGAGSAAASARPRMSPTAEAVWAVCSDQVPPGAEDRRQIAELLDTLAKQRSAEARTALLHCLESPVGPTEARTAAARLLIELDVERDRVVAALRKLLRNREPEVRLWHKSVLALLFDLRAKEALPEIADAILVTEEEARSLGLADVVDAAVRALVDFDTPESWAAIERAAADSRASVRRPVVQALSALFNRPRARARLLQFLDDPSPDVRTRACTLLLYEPLSRRDRRPDLFPSNPCFVTTAAWPGVAARVRQAIETYDAYAAKQAAKRPPGPGSTPATATPPPATPPPTTPPK